MNLQLDRYSFWHTRKGTLRHAEHSPPKADHEHQVCNCTKHVTERPEGEPDQIQPSVEWTAQMGKYRVRVTTGAGQVHFTLRWTRDVPRVTRWGTDTEDHAYFWFNPEKCHLQVEITGTGDNDEIDCSFGSVRFGNRADTSTLFNGHSPSRIVDLTQIAPEAVWAHDCSWGHEAMDFVTEPEAAEWRRQFERAVLIRDTVGKYELRTTPLDELRQHLLDEAALAALIDEGFLYLVRMAETFTTTGLYRVTKAVKQRAREAERLSERH